MELMITLIIKLGESYLVTFDIVQETEVTFGRVIFFGQDDG